MIEVRYKGQIGNRMFQYALGRILAEHFGYEFIAAAPADVFRIGRVEGKTYKHPTERLEGHNIPLERIMANRAPRRILLNGYFQRAEYYVPFRNSIRQWYAVSGRDLRPGEVVLHIRRGAYLQMGMALDLDYYTQALKEVRPEILHVCGIGIDDAVRKHLAPWKPVYSNAKPMEDFAIMQSARTLIASNSTFSWWAGFLSWHRVFAPLTKRGPGSKNEEYDLAYDDPRYIETTCVQP